MHILSACPVLASTAYVHRHNAALRVLYYHLRHSYGIDQAPTLPHLGGDIESVVENERSRIYWNFPITTVRHLPANKPDVLLLDKQEKCLFVIEFSAPAENNIKTKEEEKRTKYQELITELRQLYPGHRVKLVVLIIGSLGGVPHSLLSELKQIPVCRATAYSLACRMQKAVLLGSLRIIRCRNITD